VAAGRQGECPGWVWLAWDIQEADSTANGTRPTRKNRCLDLLYSFLFSLDSAQSLAQDPITGLPCSYLELISMGHLWETSQILIVSVFWYVSNL
jgi:hypothetical protein